MPTISAMPTTPWQIWADTGGTFTDALGVAPDGRILRAKVLSSGCLRAKVEEITPNGLVRLSHAFGEWSRISDAATGWLLRMLGTEDAREIEQWGEAGVGLPGEWSTLYRG